MSYYFPEFLLETFFALTASWSGGTCRRSAYRYLHGHYFHTFSGTIEVSRQLFVRFFSAKFHKNPLWVLSCYIQTEEWSSFKWFGDLQGFRSVVEVKKSSLIRQGNILTVVNLYMARCGYESQMESVGIPGRREDHYQPSGCKVMKRHCQSSTCQ